MQLSVERVANCIRDYGRPGANMKICLIANECEREEAGMKEHPYLYLPLKLGFQARGYTRHQLRAQRQHGGELKPRENLLINFYVCDFDNQSTILRALNMHKTHLGQAIMSLEVNIYTHRKLFCVER